MPLKPVPLERAFPVEGIRLGGAQAGNRSRDGLAAISIDRGASVAGVFTRNRFPAAPVQLCRERLRGKNGIRGILVNSGIANAGTGRQGIMDANKMCKAYAALLGCQAQNILPVSTGVIMKRMPVSRYMAGIKKCFSQMAEDNWRIAARAIMTSDTAPKIARESVASGGKKFFVTGIAKGSAMICPNMATMLAFVATDAALPKRRLAALQRGVARDTFNAVSVDGDASTNDSFILIATGKKGACAEEEKLQKAILRVCSRLAEYIVRDGIGAGKLLRIIVSGGKSRDACMQTARQIGLSPLVKLSLTAKEPDIGRFLMAIGNSANQYALADVSAKIGNVPIIKGNNPHPKYNGKLAAKHMAGEEIVLSIKLGSSPYSAAFMTCNLTAGYITRFGNP